jgi:hypothetical protein
MTDAASQRLLVLPPAFFCFLRNSVIKQSVLFHHMESVGTVCRTNQPSQTLKARK